MRTKVVVFFMDAPGFSIFGNYYITEDRTSRPAVSSPGCCLAGPGESILLENE
jgi:hypothetical protein